MNGEAIRILFLKDLFLARRPLFAYLMAGLAAVGLACVPNETLGFVGFILIITIAIASGIHLIGILMLAETSDQTRLFVMSLPVSLLDYAVAKVAVVLTTFLIPWSTMLAGLTILSLVVPDAKPGVVAVLPMIFLYLLAGFAIQLLTAVVTESVGWTICILVGCNVMFNVFLKVIYDVPAIAAVAKSPTLFWPPVVLQVVYVELTIIALVFAIAFFFQTRSRDLV